MLDSFFNIYMPLLIFPVRKSVRQIMSDSQRTEEERAHTKILKTERELFFRMKFSASIKFWTYFYKLEYYNLTVKIQLIIEIIFKFIRKFILQQNSSHLHIVRPQRTTLNPTLRITRYEDAKCRFIMGNTNIRKNPQ